MYCSTREKNKSNGGDTGLNLNFTETALLGLADDGGLLVPKYIPEISKITQRYWRNLPYRQLCFEVFRTFIPIDEIPDDDLLSIITAAYSDFRHPECVSVIPLNPMCIFTENEIENNDNIPTASYPSVYLLELFHGPSYAFKDLALQFLGQLFRYLMKTQKNPITFLGATSGDTGSAAIKGLENIEGVGCVILYPEGKLSYIQQLQMTTTKARNVCCISIKGASFDDCQTVVKKIFASPLKKKLHLAAINSINWARILAQIVYYWYSAFRIQNMENEPEQNACVIDVCVPTGNFGNILAAYYAKKMGAPLGRLIIASNANNILTRAYHTGAYEVKEVISTSSPSMDIQISSNFERLLYDMYNKESAIMREKFEILLPETNGFNIEGVGLKTFQSIFSAYSASEADVISAIQSVYNHTHLTNNCPTILDPHTAVAVAAVKKYVQNQPNLKKKQPILVAATAHFGKFPDFLMKVLGADIINQYMPQVLTDLTQKKSHFISCELLLPDIIEILTKHTSLIMEDSINKSIYS